MCFLLGLLPFLTYFGLQHVSDTKEPAAETNESALYQQLLRKALGDKAKVERLIEHERLRNLEGKRADWLRTALERWERDAK